MASTGSMTASVWLAPMIPKLPLPLAQRVHRLLGAKPGRDTEDHALRLCEGIVAYAACIRASFAAAVVPAGQRATIGAGIVELRRVVQRGEATLANYRDLLLAAADAIDEVEPGHLLGRAELTRSRTSWVARMQLVEALDGNIAVSDAIRTRAIDGGIAGIVDLWVSLIEARRAAKTEPEAHPWLPPLGDLIVDLLSSSVFGGASLLYPEQAADGGPGDLRRLHGLESEVDPESPDSDQDDDDHELGVVCWRFEDRVVSSCGLLSYWIDEHELEHVGVLAKQITNTEYFDYGAGKHSPTKQTSGRVDWAGLHASEAAVTVGGGHSRTPLIAIAVAVALLLIVGVSWSLLRNDGDADADADARLSAGSPASDEQPTQDQPAPEIDDEIVIESEASTETGGATRSLGRGGTSGETGEEALEPEVVTAPVWFESERNLGICRVSYNGQTRVANLHLKTRQPEGKLEFSYRCGQYRGRGSILVKQKRVNGVLFCKKGGAVKVKTVRSNEGRCDR